MKTLFLIASLLIASSFALEASTNLGTSSAITSTTLTLTSTSTSTEGIESPPDSKVVHVNENNIVQKTYNQEKVVMLFYAPWCPHCMAFRPTYEKFAKEAPKSVTVADVDATVETYLQDSFGVVGYPTVFLFVDGKMYEYLGARNVAALKNFVEGGYKFVDPKELPKLDSVSAMNFHRVQRLTKALYSVLVGAVVLGVIGIIAYFYCFNEGRSAAKELFRLKMAKNKDWLPILNSKDIMTPTDDAFVRPELA